jgi:hypothetical protein
MTITWRDGITTLAAGAAVLIERSYFHDWGWPLVHQVGWAVCAVALLGFAIFRFSYAMDDKPGTGWSVIAYLSSLLAAGLAAGGIITDNSDFLVWTMIIVIFFWLASVLRHIFISSAQPKRNGGQDAMTIQHS